jgi:hypothetical protein
LGPREVPERCMTGRVKVDLGRDVSGMLEQRGTCCGKWRDGLGELRVTDWPVRGKRVGRKWRNGLGPPPRILCASLRRSVFTVTNTLLRRFSASQIFRTRIAL